MKVFRFILFILILIITTSFNFVKNDYNTKIKFEVVGGEKIYRDLGTYRHNFYDGTYIMVSAYILKKLNTTGHYPKFKYEYRLVAISKSHNGSRIAETWLYNNRIFLNGIEITRNQFPNGMTTFIDTTPTNIYSWFTSDESIGNLEMRWENSVYENR